MASSTVDQLPVAESPTPTIVSVDSLRPESPYIYINEEGVHDFDFRHRQGSAGSHKLKKFGRRSVRSVSSMAEMQRSPSTSSNGSLRKRFSSLFVSSNDSNVNLSNKCHKSTASIESKHQTPEDPLPDTKKDLEIRLNYHLSELDILKKTIRAANDVVRQHQDRYQILEMRSTPDMEQSMKRQGQLVQLARNNRNAYAGFVGYHRRQLERIKQKRIEIEEAAGLEPTLPEVYKNLWTDDDWATIFRT